jgi:hypothetical protein
VKIKLRLKQFATNTNVVLFCVGYNFCLLCVEKREVNREVERER